MNYLLWVYGEIERLIEADKAQKECIKELVVACKFNNYVYSQMIMEKHKELISEILEVESE